MPWGLQEGFCVVSGRGCKARVKYSTILRRWKQCAKKSNDPIPYIFLGPHARTVAVQWPGNPLCQTFAASVIRCYMPSSYQDFHGWLCLTHGAGCITNKVPKSPSSGHVVNLSAWSPTRVYPLVSIMVLARCEVHWCSSAIL